MLHAFTHMYQVALMPLYLRIETDLRLSSVEEATLLVTVMGIAYYLPSYPLGMMADRWSRKRLMAAGLAINGLGFVGLAFAPNYAWAMLSVVVAGFGGSFYHPAATALIARLFPTAALWAFFLAADVLFSLRDFAASAMSTSTSLFLQNAHGFSPKITGIALSAIFVASAISNPLFGHLSDGGRGLWITFVLLVAGYGTGFWR